MFWKNPISSTPVCWSCRTGLRQLATMRPLEHWNRSGTLAMAWKIVGHIAPQKFGWCGAIPWFFGHFYFLQSLVSLVAGHFYMSWHVMTCRSSDVWWILVNQPIQVKGSSPLCRHAKQVHRTCPSATHSTASIGILCHWEVERYEESSEWPRYWEFATLKDRHGGFHKWGVSKMVGLSGKIPLK